MQPADFTPSDFRLFTDLLHQRTGLYFDDNKFAVVRGAVKERIKVTGLATPQAYYDFLIGQNNDTVVSANETLPVNTFNRLSASPAEREFNRLIELLTVNETSFFRNKDHFRAISEEVLPRLIRRHQHDRLLRIWSAGCSYGQEPYSLAIAVTQVLEKLGYSLHGALAWKVEIVASDINERALKIAQAGRYRRDEMRGLDEATLNRYFLPVTSAAVTTAPLEPSQIESPNRAPLARSQERIAYHVAPEIKSLIKFNSFNLASPSYPYERLGSFDLVLCENVTIYFPPHVTQRVIHNIYNIMNDGAFLFIGYSETLWQVSDNYKLINSHDTFYYQKPFPGETIGGYLRNQPLTGPLPYNNDANRLGSTRRSQPVNTTDKLNARIDSRFERTPPPNPLMPPAKSLEALVARSANPPTPPPLAKAKEPITPPPAPSPTPAPTETWRTFLEQGLRLMKEHEFEKAANLLQQAYEADPEQPQVLVALARLKTTLGDYKQAFEFSRRAVQLDQLCEDAHLILAMIHRKEGRIGDSIVEFQNTIYINFESVIAHIRLADIYRDMGQTANAIKEYKSALTSLARYRPDDSIEDLPVELLKRTCEDNLRRLTPRKNR